jgi:hypothetical protein
MKVGDLVRYADPDPDCVELGVIACRSNGWIYITWWADGDINNEGHLETTDEIVIEENPDATALEELKDLMRTHRWLYMSEDVGAENLPESWANE